MTETSADPPSAWTDPPTVHRRRLLVRFFLDYNPCYLLSAMCMLFGLFSLNDSLDWSPLPVQNLLWLILILNVYEFMLVGIGIFLARRGLMRDAATLFILEAFFLADAGFLNAEVFNFNFGLGLLINVYLFFLTIVKAGAIFKGLRLKLSDTRLPLVLVQMLLLLATPGLLKHVSDNHNAQVTGLALYAVWWIVGAIPVLYLLLMPHPSESRYPVIIGSLVLLPTISILAHLCTSNWVYHVRWQSANLSPILLGLAIAIGASDRHVRSLATRMRLHLSLPLLAILLASSNPTWLFFYVGSIPMSPTRLVLFGAVVVYALGLLLHRHPYFGVAGALCLSAATLGESPTTMSRNVMAISESSSRTVWRLVPRTIAEWGLISLVMSFLLLGLGLMLSLVRPIPVLEMSKMLPDEEDEDDTT